MTYPNKPYEESLSRLKINDSDDTTADLKREIIGPFRTTRELEAEPIEAIDWMILGFLTLGGLTEIVGKPKGGKTWLTLYLVRCVLDGLKFLGRRVKQSPVVYLTEQPFASFRPALESWGLLGRDDLTILRWHSVASYPWERVAEAATEECIRRGAKLLVVDTRAQFAGLAGEQENQSGPVLQSLRPLQIAAAEQGLAVWSCAHERKGGGGDISDAVRGSNAAAGAVDILLAIRRPEGRTRETIRVLESLSRFRETPGTLAIEYTEDGYRSLGDKAAVASVEALDALRELLPVGEEAAVPSSDLWEQLPSEVSRSSAQRELGKMEENGEVSRVGRGVRGDPNRYFRNPEFVSAQYRKEFGQKQSDKESDSSSPSSSETLSAQPSLSTGQKEKPALEV